MALGMLVSARWLGNRGVSLRHRGGTRFVPAGGAVTVNEACRLLKLSPMRVYRAIRAGHLELVAGNGVAKVGLKALRRWATS
jgi:excisionase family DNA binding protein